MPDWASYRLSDFLLFSPRTYWRLFELYNAEVWPAHLAALAAGLAMLGLSLRGGRWAAAALATLLAACWLWVAWAFHLQRYASINWAAPGFAAGFAAQGLMLLAYAAHAAFGARRLTASRGTAKVGIGLFAVALLVQPGIGWLLGRDWTQADVFGISPDPTVLGTLGVLLLLPGAAAPGTARAPVWILWPVPLLWCLVSGATLWAMGSPDALLLPLAGSIAVAAAWRGSEKTATAGRSG